MPLIVYTDNIPVAGNNPAVDQPSMTINTNSIDTLIGIDHYSFNQSLGGLHKQVEMPVLGSIPAGLLASTGNLYTKSSTGSQLYYSPDTTGNEYQLTRSISASFSLFGANTNNYNASGANFNGGWTFLPGGLLMQYGLYNPGSLPSSPATIPFPVTFSSIPYLVTVSLVCKVAGTNSSHTVSVVTGTVSTSQFQWNLDGGSTSNYTGIYWTAVGK